MGPLEECSVTRRLFSSDAWFYRTLGRFLFVCKRHDTKNGPPPLEATNRLLASESPTIPLSLVAFSLRQPSMSPYNRPRQELPLVRYGPQGKRSLPPRAFIVMPFFPDIPVCRRTPRSQSVRSARLIFLPLLVNSLSPEVSPSPLEISSVPPPFSLFLVVTTNPQRKLCFHDQRAYSRDKCAIYLGFFFLLPASLFHPIIVPLRT